jgi:SM-20-related protein
MSVPLNYEGLAAAPVATDPFPYLVLPGFVGQDDLERLVRSLPPMEAGGSFPPEALDLTPEIAGLVAELQGPRLRSLIAGKFGLDLSSAPTMLTLRGRTREQDGRIHRDSEAKLVTILLYLNPDSPAWDNREGCLRLLRGPDDIEDYAAEVPPSRGTLLVFPNGPATWHGHRQYIGPRYTIQLNYMATSAKARYEMRRHRLSALFKRLKLAAS